ncbi:MAG TPA: metallophosphoesterase [Kofleriaceae bacterium]
MTRVLVTCLALLAACAQNRLEWDDPESHALMTGPYVLLTGAERAIVGFRSANATSAKVEWRAETGERGTVVADRDRTLFWAQLSGLPRGPKIEYEVTTNGASAGKGTFRVGTKAGDPKVRFAVFGDTRNGHEVHREVVLGVAREEGVDFVLNTGDMVQNGGKPNEWITFFQIERPLLAKMPIIPTTGNHDLSGRLYYERFFFLDRWSGGRRYFATDWGNMRVIALDNGIECNRACAQFNFVRDSLADGAAKGKLLVMFLHHSPFSSGHHGSDLGVQRAIHELAETYGVELVISGHDHHYERTKPLAGTTYIVSGSAGAPIRPVTPQDFTASARTEPHYVIVDVDGDTITTRAINLRGEAFDTTVIQPNLPLAQKPSRPQAVR